MAQSVASGSIAPIIQGEEHGASPKKAIVLEFRNNSPKAKEKFPAPRPFEKEAHDDDAY